MVVLLLHVDRKQLCSKTRYRRGGYSAGWNFCFTNSVRNFCAQFVRCF